MNQSFLNRLQNVENGRVDIMNQKPNKKFNIFNQRNNGNKLYKNEAIKSIHSESKLSQVFFSNENINLLQDLIRHTVWRRSHKKHIIGRQSDLQLKIIMRSIYFQYGQNLNCLIKEQIKKLNEIVVNECVPKILSEVQQFIHYKKDVSGLAVPLERPKYLNNAGTKSLMPNYWL